MYVDSMDTLFFWSWLATFCMLALFIQGVLLLLIVFVVTGVIEARFLPRVKFPPIWAMRRMDSFQR